MNDTIVVIATAHGVGSISIIRLNGERTLEIALELSKKNELCPRYAIFTKLFNRKNELLDKAIVAYFKAPFSLTGEDIVEFQVHGGFSVSETLLEELISLGTKLTEPEELNRRACLRDKMSPLKALNIQDLILAKSANAAEIITRNIQRSSGKLLDKIRTDLVKTLAFVGTGIDYADDDLSSDLLEQISTMCEENSKIPKEICTLSENKKGLVKGFKIAIVGKPDVGRSSLLDALLSYKRVIVSDIAGTARDIIEESLRLGTHLLRIIGATGIQESKDETEQIGIELNKESVEGANIILAIFDNSGEEDEGGENIFKLLSQSDKKIFYLLDKSGLEAQFDKPYDIDFIEPSVQNDIQILKEKLEKCLNSLDSDGFLVNSIALIDTCKISSEATLGAKELLSENSLELFAFELNLAIGGLAKFTKDFNRNEILDEMFGNFCLGK